MIFAIRTAALLCSTFATFFAPNGFVYPLNSGLRSSSFGHRIHPISHSSRHHAGVDLAAPKGEPILAVFDGTVIFAGTYAGYGKLVVLRHRGGVTTHYGHCDSIMVNVGDLVLAGTDIATVGSTGQATGPHLHFEVRLDGTPQDPEQFLIGVGENSADG